MNGVKLLSLLADYRWSVYAGGLLAVVGVQSALLSRSIRIALASLTIIVMGATYAGEQLGDELSVVRPGFLVVGLGGIGLGSVLALSGSTAGVAFLAGGLLFLRRIPAGPGESG